MEKETLKMLTDLLGPMFGATANVATGGLASGIGTLGVGLAQGIPSLINMVKLNRIERPEYQTLQGVENAVNRAEQRAQYGFSPTQVANFQSNLGNVLQSDFRNARDMSGGGLAQAINSRGIGQRLRSVNQFAADDATQMQRNIQDAFNAQRFAQGEKNRQTAQKIDYRMRDEGSTGATLGSSFGNVGSYFNQNAALGNFGNFGNSGNSGFGGMAGGPSGSYLSNGTDPSLGGFTNPNLIPKTTLIPNYAKPFGK
jgi:hypothetical protein